MLLNISKKNDEEWDLNISFDNTDDTQSNLEDCLDLVEMLEWNKDLLQKAMNSVLENFGQSFFANLYQKLVEQRINKDSEDDDDLSSIQIPIYSTVFIDGHA